jgi:hypothetical protein
MKRLLAFLATLLVVSAAHSAERINVSKQAAEEIGRRVWKNECGGTVTGLTAWNKGEDFPSLGIGHFIWYPVGTTGPFDESFPKLIRFLAKSGVDVPEALRRAKGAPWPTRAVFQKEFNSRSMVALRGFLKQTVPQQAQFLVLRLEQALPKMEAAAPSKMRARIRENFYRVAGTPQGVYALIDYVNFKGEGIKSSERYKGEGWGLLQVLAGMEPGLSGRAAVQAFADSANRVLTRRVRNAPPARNEGKWLPGWRNRLKTYTQ